MPTNAAPSGPLLGREVVEERRLLLARVAPRGPEVHDDGPPAIVRQPQPLLAAERRQVEGGRLGLVAVVHVGDELAGVLRDDHAAHQQREEADEHHPRGDLEGALHRPRVCTFARRVGAETWGGHGWANVLAIAKGTAGELDRKALQTMRTGTPSCTRWNSHSASGMRRRMQPCEAE